MQSMKFAHLVREHTDAAVYEFYIDIRAPGKAFDEFYERVQAEGTQFIRGRVAEVTNVLRRPEEAREDGRLIVQVEDTLAGRQRRIPVDMVVLSVGLEPQPDSQATARLFGITCSSQGWIIERHPKRSGGDNDGWRSLPAVPWGRATSRPRFIRRPRRRASWAASSEMALADRRGDDARCSGCRICNDLCPFSAIGFDAPAGVSDVNPALCQGCGVCVAACPANAISATGFTNDQVVAQIEGLLSDRAAVPA
jgi:heterodisulfide reductase subunit A